MDKCEYKVIPLNTQGHSDHFRADAKPIIDNIQDDLNVVGNEGWELVSVQDIKLPDGRMFTVTYLKRQNERACWSCFGCWRGFGGVASGY